MGEYDITPENCGFRTVRISNGSTKPSDSEIALIEGREDLKGFNRTGPYSISGREGEWEIIYHKSIKENVSGRTLGVSNGRY